MASQLIGDLTTSTIESRSKEIADNVTQHNAALLAIKNAKGIQTFDGGTYINEAIDFTENGNGSSYSGYDTLQINPTSTLTTAQYSFAQYAVPIVYNGRETLINNGKQQIIDLVASRVTNAERTMANMLNRHFYLDGTGNNGKNLTGLAAAIPLANTAGTYGGINRGDYAFWRNKKYQASVDGAGVATTGAQLISQWNVFVQRLTRGTDMPNMIIAAPEVFALYESGVQDMLRLSDTKMADAGFTTLMFKGIPVVFDSADSGIDPKSAYFLNTKYMKWRPHAKQNMIALDDKSPVNQDMTVKTLVWAGNLTMSGAQYQGVYSNS